MRTERTCRGTAVPREAILSAATRPAADAKRLAELEKRIDALEAKLDLLMKLLKDKDK